MATDLDQSIIEFVKKHPGAHYHDVVKALSTDLDKDRRIYNMMLHLRSVRRLRFNVMILGWEVPGFEKQERRKLQGVHDD